MYKKLQKKFKTDPFYIFSRTVSVLQLFLLKLRKNIEIKKNVKIRGLANIDIYDRCNLYIGEGVTLNSRNRGYHINMHSPVKIFADRPGAIIKIGDYTRIHGTCIHAYESIKIGKNCLIAANCQIIDGNGHDTSFPNVANRINTKGKSKPIVIEDNVWIGANSFILPGVTIGEGSIISANSVVTKSIPKMVIAAGNPATIVKNN